MGLFKAKKVFKLRIQDKNGGKNITFSVREGVYNFIIDMKKPEVVGFEERM